MPTPRTVPIHNLGHNHREITPHRLLTLACATKVRAEGDDERHTLDCWHLCLWTRHNETSWDSTPVAWQGNTTGELIAALGEAVRAKHTTWLYSMELGRDLALTWLPSEMLERGWVLGQHALTADTPWARFSTGSKRLVMADARGLFQHGIASLSHWQHRSIPGVVDRKHAHRMRQNAAKARAEVLGVALCRLFAWWQVEGCGSWSLSGPSNGWHILTHRFLHHNVTIVPNDGAAKLERLAVAGGYHRITHRGIVPFGPFAEIDLAHAYASIASHEPMPSRRSFPTHGGDGDLRWLGAMGYDLIAHARIRTERPFYPVRLEGRVWYPVGEFWTVLCGPELREAYLNGELCEIGSGWVYRVSPWLRDFSLWLVTALDGGIPDYGPEVLSFLKGISRSVYGRTALQISAVLEERPTPLPGWSVEYGIDLDTMHRQTLMTLGGTVQRLVKGLEGDNSIPAVLAFIQSHLRVAMARAVEAMGEAAVQANTDGMIVDLERLRRRWQDYYGPQLDNLDPYLWIAERAAAELTDACPWGEFRVKRVASALWLASYQHLKLGNERKLSGVPRGAGSTARGVYEFYAESTLRETLRQYQDAGYVRHGRTVDIGKVRPLAWVRTEGTVSPISCYVDSLGATRIEGESPLWGHISPLDVPENQHMALRGHMLERGDTWQRGKVREGQSWWLEE